MLARKEAHESRYWIRVLCAIGSDSPEGQALAQETQELINILSALINKGKRNLGATQLGFGVLEFGILVLGFSDVLFRQTL